MNLTLLYDRMETAGVTVDGLADKIGMPKSTLYRKLNSDNLSVSEAKQIVDALGLSNRDTLLIFF